MCIVCGILIDLGSFKPTAMTLTELTNDYKDYLFNSFVENFALWECCVNFTNEVIMDINQKFDTSISCLYYDEFCKMSIPTIRHFVQQEDLEKRLLVTTKMVESTYPYILSLSVNKRRAKILFYQDIIRKQKIGELEEEIYKACICSILKKLAPDYYGEYQIFFELRWSLKKALCNQ